MSDIKLTEEEAREMLVQAGCFGCRSGNINSVCIECLDIKIERLKMHHSVKKSALEEAREAHYIMLNKGYLDKNTIENYIGELEKALEEARKK